MALYKPGTLDDEAVIARIDRRQRREIAGLYAPSGSQLYATTEKVQGLAEDVGTAREKADEAFDMASRALASSGQGYEFQAMTEAEIKSIFAGL